MSNSSTSEEEANLQTYQIQLQQVEAALSNDPNSAELIKLKSDLEEIISLTTELIDATKIVKKVPQQTVVNKQQIAANNEKSVDGDDFETGEDFSVCMNQIDWKPGMTCYAPWSQDGKLNVATIVEVSADKLTVKVSFEGYNLHEKLTVNSLKHPRQVSDFIKQRSKRNVMIVIRDKKKKKTQTRMQKLKEIDDTKEKEKKTWNSFLSKTNKKGINKKSIFRSTDSNKFDGSRQNNTGGECPIDRGMSSRF